VERVQPWTLKKDPAKARELQDACTVALNLFRQLAVYLAPVLPKLAEQTGALLGKPIVHWDESKSPLVGTPVAAFQPMMQRVDPARLAAVFPQVA
jgi:methionyl-tRNA synthetase